MVLWLAFLLGLALYLMDFSKENIAYCLLYLSESAICLFFLKKKRNVLFLVIAIDLSLNTCLNTVIPVLIEHTYFSLEQQLSIYNFSLYYYDFCMLFRIVSIQVITFSYLIFGYESSFKVVLKSVILIFFLQQLFVELVSIEYFLLMFSLLGILNYLFFLLLKRARNKSLSFKRELLFLLYFIGSSLGVLEILSSIGLSEYYSTSYNYTIFLVVSYYVLNASEERLKFIIYNNSFKLGLIVLILFVLIFDQFSHYYILQSAFLVLMLLFLMQVNRRISFVKQ